MIAALTTGVPPPAAPDPHDPDKTPMFKAASSLFSTLDAALAKFQQQQAQVRKTPSWLRS